MFESVIRETARTMRWHAQKQGWKNTKRGWECPYCQTQKWVIP
jgi:hypothetical protein